MGLTRGCLSAAFSVIIYVGCRGREPSWWDSLGQGQSGSEALVSLVAVGALPKVGRDTRSFLGVGIGM